jgi:hypothetical protein
MLVTLDISRWIVAFVSLSVTAERAGGPDPVIKSATTSAPTAVQDHWVLNDSGNATNTLEHYLGVTLRESPKTTVRLAVLVRDNTPLLPALDAERPVWHVITTELRLKLKSLPEGIEDLYARTWDVLLDPLDGHLIKIISRWPSEVPTIPPEPSAVEYAAQMESAGEERYLGFPQEKPTVLTVS